MNYWLNWKPDTQKFENPPTYAPTKPTEPNFDGFDGSIQWHIQKTHTPAVSEVVPVTEAADPLSGPHQVDHLNREDGRWVLLTWLDRSRQVWWRQGALDGNQEGEAWESEIHVSPTSGNWWYVRIRVDGLAGEAIKLGEA